MRMRRRNVCAAISARGARRMGSLTVGWPTMAAPSQLPPMQSLSRRGARRVLTIVIATLATALASCGGDIVGAPLRGSQPFFVRVVSGNDQIGIVGTQLAAPLVVHVEDSTGVS